MKWSSKESLTLNCENEVNWIRIHQIRPVNVSITAFGHDFKNFTHLHELESIKLLLLKENDFKLLKLNPHLKHIEFNSMKPIREHISLIIKYCPLLESMYISGSAVSFYNLLKLIPSLKILHTDIGLNFDNYIPQDNIIYENLVELSFNIIRTYEFRGLNFSNINKIFKKINYL